MVLKLETALLFVVVVVGVEVRVHIAYVRVALVTQTTVERLADLAHMLLLLNFSCSLI